MRMHMESHRRSFRGGVLALCGLLPACLGPARAATTLVSDMAGLGAAVGKAQPGDTIALKDGAWSGAINFKANGTESTPIVITAQTPGKAVFGGNSYVTLDGSWLVVDGLSFQGAKASMPYVTYAEGSSHCRVTNSAFVGGSAPGRWIHFLATGTYNRFDHNYVSGMNQSGQTVQVEVDPKIPNYNLIDNNFFGNRPPGNGNGFETFRIGFSFQQFNISRTTTLRNLFYHCDGENEVISSKSCENRYLYNTFQNNNGHLSNRHGSRAWIEGNFFLQSAGGVRVIDSGHTLVNNYFDVNDFGIMIYKGVNTAQLTSYKQVVGGLIAFNTMVNCNIQVGGGGGTLVPTGVKIANNIAYGTQTFVQYLSTPTNFSYEGNMGNAKAGNATGFVTKDPMLNKDADGIYRPSAGSPAKDAAVGDYPDVTKDINGNARSDGKKDVGAVEIDAGSTILHPLTQKDVGPWWMGNVTPPGSDDGSIVSVGRNWSGSPMARIRPAWSAPGTRLLGNLGTGMTRVNDLLGRRVMTLVSPAATPPQKPAAGTYVITP